MAITYRWNFDPLEVEYSSASLANVVKIVHWQYHAETEGTSSIGGVPSRSGSFYASSIGTVNTGPVASSDFVAYASLTEAIVLGWVTASLGDDTITEIQTGVSKSLEAQLNPPTGRAVGGVPW